MSQEVGYVVSNKDFLVYLNGLPTIHVNDMVCSEEGARGWVNALREDTVEVLMVDDAKITPKKLFKKLSTYIISTLIKKKEVKGNEKRSFRLDSPSTCTCGNS